MSDTNKLPIWFWVVSGLALVWNLLGLGAFFSDFFMMTPERLAEMEPAMQNVYATTPSWANVAFGVAVICGVLGSIGLLIKQDWAAPVFAISLLAVLVQMFYAYFISNSYEVFGPGGMIMPLMVIAVAILLVWFAHSSTMKGWLR
jgi:hypothetical protein